MSFASLPIPLSFSFAAHYFSSCHEFSTHKSGSKFNTWVDARAVMFLQIERSTVGGNFWQETYTVNKRHFSAKFHFLRGNQSRALHSWCRLHRILLCLPVSERNSRLRRPSGVILSLLSLLLFPVVVRFTSSSSYGGGRERPVSSNVVPPPSDKMETSSGQLCSHIM